MILPLHSGIDLNSDTDSVEGKIAHLRIRFDPPLQLHKAEHPRFIKIKHLKLGWTTKNFSPSLGNNTLRYSMTGAGGPFFTINIPEGLFSVYDINDFIQTELYNNGHTEIDYDTGKYIYPWSCQVNGASSHGYLTIDTKHSSYLTVYVDLTNNGTSTFYLTYGFLIGEATLLGSVATQSIGTNNVDILDATFYITCNVVQSYVSGRRIGNILYSGLFTCPPNGYFIIKSSDDIVGYLGDLREIRDLDIKFVDRNGTLLDFHDTSIDSNITMSFYIY